MEVRVFLPLALSEGPRAWPLVYELAPQIFWLGYRLLVLGNAELLGCCCCCWGLSSDVPEGIANEGHCGTYGRQKEKKKD
jgi:hypothetical protein